MRWMGGRTTSSRERERWWMMNQGRGVDRAENPLKKHSSKHRRNKSNSIFIDESKMVSTHRVDSAVWNAQCLLGRNKIFDGILFAQALCKHVVFSKPELSCFCGISLQIVCVVFFFLHVLLHVSLSGLCRFVSKHLQLSPAGLKNTHHHEQERNPAMFAELFSSQCGFCALF